MASITSRRRARAAVAPASPGDRLHRAAVPWRLLRRPLSTRASTPRVHQGRAGPVSAPARPRRLRIGGCAPGNRRSVRSGARSLAAMRIGVVRSHRPGRRRHAAACSSSGRSPSTRSATSPRPARPGARCRGSDGEIDRRGLRHRRPSTASTSRCSPTARPPRKELAPKVAAAGATVVDNSSAWRMDPDVPLVVAGVNDDALGVDPQGHRRQPQLHDHGGDGGAQGAAREAGLRRLVVSTYQAVSGGGLRRGRRARRAGPQGRRRRRRASPSTATPSSSRAPTKFAATDRLQRDPVRRLARRRRPRRDRRGAEAPQREPQDPRASPTCSVSVTCVRVPVFTGHSLSINAEFERPDHARAEATEVLAAAGPGSCSPTSPRRSWPPARDPTFVGRIRQDEGVEAAGASPSSCRTTTSARAPPSTPSRSPSCSPPGRQRGTWRRSRRRQYPASDGCRPPPFVRSPGAQVPLRARGPGRAAAALGGGRRRAQTAHDQRHRRQRRRHGVGPGRPVAEGGSADSWHHDYTAELPRTALGTLSPVLPSEVRLTVDVHADPTAATPRRTYSTAFLAGGSNQAVVANARGSVRLDLRKGTGTCADKPVAFDGTTATVNGGAWAIVDASGAYRGATGTGTFNLQAAVAPGADNPFSLQLSGTVDALDPTITVQPVTSFWGNLGVDYLNRVVTVVYRFTNTGPGDAFGPGHQDRGHHRRRHAAARRGEPARPGCR